MIENLDGDATCPACEDTGWVLLSSMFRVGRRVLQPACTGCLWCQAGAREFARPRRRLLRDYTLEDVVVVSPEPDFKDAKVKLECQEAFEEFKRSFRAMQATSMRRDAELRKGVAA